MKFKLTTYRTVNGNKLVLETLKNRNSQWVVYKDNKPTFFVDVFDLKTESNVVMNSLIFTARKSIQEILKIISKKNKVKLSVSKPPVFSLKVKSEVTELKLKPIPEEWVNYSL